MPPWLRWAVFLPLGVAGSLLAGALVQLAFGMAGTGYRTMPGLLESSVVAFVSGATLTFLPAVLSPRPWLVGLVMLAVGLVWRVAPAAYLVITAPYLRSRAPLVAVVIAAAVLGGGVGLLLVRWRRRGTPDSRDDAESQRRTG